MINAELLMSDEKVAVYYDISLRISHAIRHRLNEGFEYHRNPNNPYTITLTRKRTSYSIFYFAQPTSNKVSMEDRVVYVGIDKRTRRIDPDAENAGVKVIAATIPSDDIEEILAVLRQEKVIW